VGHERAFKVRGNFQKSLVWK